MTMVVRPRLLRCCSLLAWKRQSTVFASVGHRDKVKRVTIAAVIMCVLRCSR